VLVYWLFFTGADDFTPVLIYVTIKAQPEYLASNLAFIERYRTSSRLVSEAQYFFVQMVKYMHACNSYIPPCM
jgi:hypothetical protein